MLPNENGSLATLLYYFRPFFTSAAQQQQHCMRAYFRHSLRGAVNALLADDSNGLAANANLLGVTQPGVINYRRGLFITGTTRPKLMTLIS